MDQSDELKRRARAATELLRPHPHRGDLIAAGAVPFTIALLLINLRLEGSWGSGAFFVVNLIAVALVLGMGVLAPMEEARPRAYQVTLQLCGLVLLFVFLLRLAQLLGAEDPLDSSGSAFWILAVVTATAAWLARTRRSALCLLVGAITGIFAVLAFVDWVFDPTGPGTTRWILLLVALALLAAALVLRERRRSESVFLIDAAGFAILVLGLTWIGELLFGGLVNPFGDDPGFAGPGAGWKVILLAAGLGLVAYAGVDQEAGPGYLGVLILLVFVVLVGQPGEGGSSLWLWPAVLLLIGAAMIGAGLRPRQPLPPEPAPPGGPAAPVRGPFAGAGGAAPAAAARTDAPAGPASTAPASAGPAAAARTDAPAGPAAADGLGKGASAEAESAVGSARSDESAPAHGASGPATAAAAASGAERAGAPQRSKGEPAAGSSPADDEPAAVAPSAAQPPEPEPPARGSLWARADPGEQPTRQQPAVRPGEDGAPTEVRPPRDA